MKHDSSQLPALISLLRKLDLDVTAEEVAEILWLAARLPPISASSGAPETPPPAAETDKTPSTNDTAAAARPAVPPQNRERFGASVTLPEESGAPGNAAANLYPAQAQTAAGGQGAHRFRSPAAYALPGPLEIARQLRPLKRRVPSRTRTLFDEAATAHRIADTGDWMPVLKAAAERWLDVTLLVDESSSMVIWQRMVSELKDLLERQGAFRTVSLWGFRSRPDATNVTLYSGIGPTANRSRPHRAAELYDPLGRRLVLVVSDCVAPVWHNGVMATLLAGWGRTGLVTLLQVLPDRLWVRSGLRTFPAIYLRSPTPGAPNVEFPFEWTTHRLPARPLHSVPVPVASLDALPLGYWAQALAGNSNLWVPGVLAIPNPIDPATGVATVPPLPPQRTTTLTAEQLLRNFYGSASPTARRLANFLAAAPLTLPIMRLVQRVVLPEARVAHLAEVFLSGLIERPSQPDDSQAADSLEYFFVEGVRDRLLNNLRLTETINVLDLVSRYVGEHLAQPLDFGALIADPTATAADGLTIGDNYQSFARIAASALRRFGGQYADLAERLDVSLGQRIPKPQVVEPRRVEDAERRPPPSSSATVTIYALLVGIDTYLSPSVSPLRGCVNDVMAARRFFQEQLHLPDQQVLLLTNEQATRAAILTAWRRHFAQAQAGDIVFVHFSAHGSHSPSLDANNPAGIDNMLVAHDSLTTNIFGISDWEVAELIREVAERGVSVRMLWDVDAGSEFFARQNFTNVILLAACRNGEHAYEYTADDPGNQMGVISYYFYDLLKQYYAQMTWGEVYDLLLVKVRAAYPQQTPQLIGDAALTLWGHERRPVAPYLLVSGVDGERYSGTINAHPALGLQLGGFVAIYPPGSAMDQAPLIYATTTATYKTSLRIVPRDDPESADFTLQVGSRVRIMRYATDTQALRVGLASDRSFVAPPSQLYVVATDTNIDYRLDWRPERCQLQTPAGQPIMEISIAPNEKPELTAVTIHLRLEQLARFRHVLALMNAAQDADLSGAITVTVADHDLISAATIQANKPVTLLLHNHSTEDLFVSLWLLNTRLAVQRLYPANSDCLLLAKGRQVHIPVLVDKSGNADTPEKVLFKVFATRQPATLDVLQLPALEQPVDLAVLLAYEQSRNNNNAAVSAATTETSPAPPPESYGNPDRPWSPGGPVAVIAKLWQPGQTIRVRFLDGAESLRQRVVNVANRWLDHANLHFVFTDDPVAEIRISFKEAGAWSYVGADCLSIPQDQPTMNFGWLRPNSADTEVQATVLRQFGHALGLVSADQSPVAHIPWDREAVYRYYAQQGWPKAQVDQNIFYQYPADRVRTGPADALSIMHKPIPAELTIGNFAVAGNSTELSPADKAFIRQLYPPTRH